MTPQEYSLYTKYGSPVVAALRVERDTHFSLNSKEKQERQDMIIMWESFWLDKLGKEAYYESRKKTYEVEMNIIEKEVKELNTEKGENALLLIRAVAKSGLTQNKFGELIGVSPWKISNILHGRGAKDIDQVMAKVKMYLNGQ